MKKLFWSIRVPAMLLVVFMLFSLAACAGSNNGTTPSTGGDDKKPAATEAPKQTKEEPVTLKILVLNTTVDTWNAGHDSPVQLDIREKTGVILEQQSVSDDQFNVILASGDLPDLVRIDRSKHAKGLIEGNQIIPLDDLLKTNGQEILKSIPSTLEYARLNWSEGREKIYFIPTQVGPDATGTGINDSIAPVLRWDYYKELGCPEIKDENDLLDVLKQMVEKHPTTEDGKKVYGVSMWTDWGNGWMFFMPLYYFTGYVTYGSSGAVARKVDPNSPLVDATKEDDPFWRAVRFYYNANKMGILDPDALTMKYADFEAKATSGQILFAGADWPFQKFNQQNANDGKGYLPIPVTNGYQWHGDMAWLGWHSKSFAITSDCKYPEKAMDLMNYLWSYDGCRTLYNGIKGQHWDVVDGKPTLKEETIVAYKANDDAWKKTNINLDLNIIGLSPYMIHPEDGQPLCLFNSEQVFSRDLNPLVKDYCDYYKAPYVGGLFNRLVAEGKNQNKQHINAFVNAFPYTPSDEIKRIESDLGALMAQYAAKCIFAKDDAQFEALKAEGIRELEKAGAQKNFESRAEWYQKAVEDAKRYE